MTKIYLDIDGVLLMKVGSLPADSMAFLQFLVDRFECYWLTTHCKGDAKTAVRYLLRHYPQECEGLLNQILPTNWDAMKTEGIDFSSPFFWLDDQPFQSERNALAANNVQASLILVDLNRPGELQRIMAHLKNQLTPKANSEA
jgi:hypothetical protein